MFLFQNIHLYSLAKNALQVGIGAAIAYSLCGTLPGLLPLLGFVIAYQSVYYLNDIVDMKEDSKDPLKKMLKPLARDNSKRPEYILKMLLFLAAGVALAFWESDLMLKLVLAVALLCNLLHSLLLKRTFLSGANMLIIEWCKFSAGYFAAMPALSLDNGLFILALSGAYIIGYGVYKNVSKNFSEMLHSSPHIVGLGIAAAALPIAWLAYTGSPVVVHAAAGLVGALPVVIAYPLLPANKRLMIGGALTLLPYAAVVASLLLL